MDLRSLLRSEPLETMISRRVPVESIDDAARYIIEKIWEGRAHPVIHELASIILTRKTPDGRWVVPPKNWEAEVRALFKFVQNAIRYTRDTYGMDTYRRAIRVLQLGMGDCVAGDTEIILLNKKTGFYEIKPIAELKDCWEEYQALSYDFERERWVFKDILVWLDKGERQVYNVKLYNGWSFRCTAGHKLFTYEGQSNRKICVRRLCDIDLSRAWKRRVVSALKIPSLDVDVDAPDDLLWLIGFYLAEGFKSGSKLSIAQDCPLVLWEIKSKVERLGGSARISKREKHAYVNVHSGPVKDALAECGNNAFDKRMPWWCLSLDRRKLEVILNAYTRGDSYVPRRGRWAEMAKVIHNTSSDMLAKQLKLMYLILGLPLSAYYQLCHMGAGNRPIWRLIQRIGRQKANNAEIRNGITYNTVRSVEPVGVQRVYDIVVADTHNFVLLNGVIVHNCDDQVILLGSLLQAVGYPIALKIVDTTDTPPGFNHIYLLVGLPPMNPRKWVPLDPTMPYDVGWEVPRYKVRDEVIYMV